MQYADGTTGTTVGYTHYVPQRRMLHLYDLGLMDDLQFTVICDAEGVTVEWVGYLGD